MRQDVFPQEESINWMEQQIGTVPHYLINLWNNRNDHHLYSNPCSKIILIYAMLKFLFSFYHFSSPIYFIPIICHFHFHK